MSMTTPADPRRAATLLGRLAADPETRTWLKKLVLHVLPDFTTVHAFALSQFTNLTEFKALSGSASVWSSVPEDILHSIWRDLWTTIARLPRLAHFVCKAQACRNSDLQLPPSPSLKRVAVAFKGVNPALSSLFDSSGITDLCLFTGGAAEVLRDGRPRGVLPWPSLRHLKITSGTKPHSTDLDAVLTHIILEVMDLSTPLPALKLLRIHVASAAPGTWTKTFSLSLKLAARLSTECLIWGEVKIADLRSGHPRDPVKSLRSFEIGSSIELSAENNFADLIDTLRCMPNLDKLVLTCSRVGSRGEPESDLSRIAYEPNDLTLAIAYPHLAILVRYLETTAITTFCLTADEGSARWLRDDPSMPFERQAW